MKMVQMELAGMKKISFRSIYMKKEEIQVDDDEADDPVNIMYLIIILFSP